jgi:hypothetical protein
MLMNDAGQAIAVLGVCAAVAISVVSIGRAYVASIEAQRKTTRPDLSPEVQERMSRIEQAVDSIALEVERMSEGQRFTTRLLAERFGDQAGAAQPAARRPTGDGSNGAGGSYGR